MAPLRWSSVRWAPPKSWCLETPSLNLTQTKIWSTWTQVRISVTMTPARRVCWVRLAASVTEPQRPLMAASWCAVAVDSRRRRWRWWTGAAVSSTGAAMSNASSVAKWWRFTLAGDGSGGGARKELLMNKTNAPHSYAKDKWSAEDVWSSRFSCLKPPHPPTAGHRKQAERSNVTVFFLCHHNG